jgi:hypothetical protein
MREVESESISGACSMPHGCTSWRTPSSIMTTFCSLKPSTTGRESVAPVVRTSTPGSFLIESITFCPRCLSSWRPSTTSTEVGVVSVEAACGLAVIVMGATSITLS